MQTKIFIAVLITFAFFTSSVSIAELGSMDKAEAKDEEPSKKDKAVEAKSDDKPADVKEEKAEKVDKVAEKKAKAEEFRKSQEAKK